jgi:hypothetical protein
MLDSLCSLGSLLAVALTSLGVGQPLARGLRGADRDRLAELVWSLALGLVAVGMALTVAGLLGWLSTAAIRMGTAAGTALGLWTFWRMRRETISGPRDESLFGAGQLNAAPSPPKWLLVGLGGLAGLALAASLVSALAPATAGDALCYHLELPKRYLHSGALGFLPYHENSTFPLLAEMWYLWAIALDGSLVGGGIAAQLVHWGLGLLFALAATLLARPVLGREWARVVGLLVLLVPGVTNQMTAPLNDVALALFTTLGLCAWREGVAVRSAALQCRGTARGINRLFWQESGQGTEVPYYEQVEPNQNSFVLAGMAFGAALGVKYLALVFIAAVGVTTVWDFSRRPERRGLLFRGAALAAVVAVSVGGVWYARAAWHRGNPVYPFFAEQFGGGGPPAFRESKTPLDNHPIDFGAAPWQITMQPERFGGRGHQLGPFFLMLLPGLAVARRLRGLAPLLAISAAYFVLWYLLRQNLRFLLPIVPLLLTAAVWVWMETARMPKAAATMVRCACAALAIFTAAIPCYRARGDWPVSLGVESRDAWLVRHEPSHRAAAFAASELPHEAVILCEDYRAYYLPCEVVRENAYRRANNYLTGDSTPDAVVELLRRDGFTHVLLVDGARDAPTRPGARSALSQALTAAAAHRPNSCRELLNYTARDDEGRSRRYRLVALAQ